MSCLDVMYHQGYGAHCLPTSQVAAAAYKAAYYRHHHHHHHHHQQQHQQQQRKPHVHNKVQEGVEQQQTQPHCPLGRQLQQQRAEMLPRDQGLRRAPLPPPGTGWSSSCSSASSGSCSSSGGSPDNFTTKDSNQPAEAEYLSSRCVLFTYFRGNIEDVVDEHFSRALSQSSSFTSESKPIRVTQSATSAAGGLWKGGVSLSEGQCSPTPSSAWSGTYQSQATPFLPAAIHPEFPPSLSPFHSTDGAIWAGHALSQASVVPHGALADTWSYTLNPQGAGGYPHLHDVYPHPQRHGHKHMSAHSHSHGRLPPHPLLHSYPAHGPALDPRFSPLLLPGVRSQTQTAPSPGSPHIDGIKTEMDPSGTSPVVATAWPPSAPHGALEVYDSALDQEKAKASAWF